MRGTVFQLTLFIFRMLNHLKVKLSLHIYCVNYVSEILMLVTKINFIEVF